MPGGTRTLAVGKPSSWPRRSPRTTTPENRKTLSLSSRTQPKSPSATACRMSVDELAWVPSVTSGSGWTLNSPVP